MTLSASIGAVERETGLSKDTLRVWERRYGFPKPRRDSKGERVYSAEEVERLRLIRRLMDRGFRPGKLVSAPLAELTARMAQPLAGAQAQSVTPAPMQELLRLVQAHKLSEMREQLSLALMRLGLQRFVIEVVAPMNAVIGDAWAQGTIAIFEEHLYSEHMQHLLRQAIGNLPELGRAPRVLLTTLPGEEHQIGLLMAQACLAAEGAQCVSLGVQTPSWEIVEAARAHRVDIVGLSFSPAIQLNAARTALTDLRQRLNAAIALWAGGSIWARSRRGVDGVITIASLGDIAAALAQWRDSHYAAPAP